MGDLDVFYKSGRRPYFRLLYLFAKRVLALLRINSKNVDFVVIYTELFPYFPSFFETFLKLKKIPYLLDYDDAIFHQYDRHKSRFIRLALGRKIAKIIKKSEVVIVGSKYLADYALKSGSRRVEIIPTVVDMDNYPISNKQKNSVFTIVWIGSPSTAKYLHDISPALIEVCKGRNIIVRLIGAGEIDLIGVNYESLSWSKEKEFNLLNECHVGIMPLPDTPWAAGKCNLKMIQYMACGLPVVASPVGMNIELVDKDKNGYLAKTNKDWTRNLIKLYDNPDLLSTMGNLGRRKVEDRYSLHKQYPRYINILKSIGKK